MSTITPPTPPMDILENTSVISKVFGYSPKTKILDYFLDFPTNDFTKKEIIEALGMSKQTFYKYFEDLEEYNLLKVNRTIGKAKLYKIDLENPMVKMIKNFEEKMSMQIAEQEAMELEETIIKPNKEKVSIKNEFMQWQKPSPPHISLMREKTKELLMAS